MYQRIRVSNKLCRNSELKSLSLGMILNDDFIYYVICIICYSTDYSTIVISFFLSYLPSLLL